MNWQRIHSQDLFSDGREASCGVRHLIRAVQLDQAQNVQKWWLSQANHVMKTVGYSVLGSYIDSVMRRDHSNNGLCQMKSHVCGEIFAALECSANQLQSLRSRPS